MKMTMQLTDLLFQKMLIHYSDKLPEEKELREIIKLEYFEYLKDYDVELVSTNFKQHVRDYPRLKPAVADLIKDTKIYSSVPGVEETRLMIEERERERENHVPADPEYVKKLIAETRLKLKEVRLNELEREHKRLSES